MIPQNSDFRQKVQELFQQAHFMTYLGVQLVDIGAGWCQTELWVARHHAQQNGYIHAGVQASIADHTAGAASATLVAANQYVLTVEYKINLLRPALGERLVCRATVLKPGRTLIVTESEVMVCNGELSKLVAKATFTMAVLTQEGKNG